MYNLGNFTKVRHSARTHHRLHYFIIRQRISEMRENNRYPSRYSAELLYLLGEIRYKLTMF